MNFTALIPNAVQKQAPVGKYSWWGLQMHLLAEVYLDKSSLLINDCVATAPPLVAVQNACMLAYLKSNSASTRITVLG